MERITIIGHVGQDATIKQGNHEPFITFSVAVSQRWKTAEGVQTESTQWYNCLYQPKTLTVAQYLRKGTKVFVEGRPKVGTYKNKEGATAVDFGIQVRGIELLSAKESEPEEKEPVYSAPEPTQAAAKPKTKATKEVVSESASDDLPF